MLINDQGQGYASSVVAEVGMRGASFQIIDYQWDAGVETFSCEAENMLRWRLRPHHVQVRASSQEGGEQQDLGQLTLQPAGVPTRGRTFHKASGVRALVFRFEEEWLHEIGHPPCADEVMLRPCFDLRSSDIDHTMRRLTQELLKPGVGTTMLAEGLAMSIAVDLMRYFAPRDPDENNQRASLVTGRLRQIRDYIESFTEGSPTLNDVAEVCGVSTAHLRKFFKAATGQTMTDFIEEVRLRRAQALLIETNVPLKVISHQLGFRHPSAFSCAFRKLAGEPPRQYRDRFGRQAPLFS